MTVSASPASSRWHEMSARVLGGETISKEEALSILQSPDTELLNLLAAVYEVRQRHFGNQVQLYYLKNAKSGLCPEDCGYCSQSKVSDASIDKYVFLNEEKLLAGAKQAAESQARTYCIVASGRGPTNREVSHVANVVKKIKAEYGLHICCCLGLLKPDQALELREAGVDRINHNLNTSRNHYADICSTHTYRIVLIRSKLARDVGMELAVD
ncbi:MAG: radical SAM protein [Planctomycetaceae bacterium]